MNKVFSPVDDLVRAATTIDLIMKVIFVNPILKSIINILKTMANMESHAEKLEIKQGVAALGVVTGIIAMEGKGCKGSLAISFTKSVIFDLAQRMLREEITEIDEKAKDLTGEITNMALGSAKSEFEQLGMDLEMTIPEVLSGNSYNVEHKYPGITVVLPFSTDAGKFYVEMCFQE